MYRGWAFMMARQVQSGCFRRRCAQCEQVVAQVPEVEKPDGHFQLLGAYGPFFDRHKLENR
jgi:hypothetical protein